MPLASRAPTDATRADRRGRRRASRRPAPAVESRGQHVDHEAADGAWQLLEPGAARRCSPGAAALGCLDAAQPQVHESLGADAVPVPHERREEVPPSCLCAVGGRAAAGVPLAAVGPEGEEALGVLAAMRLVETPLPLEAPGQAIQRIGTEQLQADQGGGLRDPGVILRHGGERWLGHERERRDLRAAAHGVHRGARPQERREHAWRASMAERPQ
mmetsp:Transcript_130262/g.353484  ORF Transcript_130262/g.353484 Transcript_130262/m.353484 type:complete len:215 (+) Transcript_130262:332-976(+)